MKSNDIETDYTEVGKVMNELKDLGIALNCREILHKKLLSIGNRGSGLMQIGRDVAATFSTREGVMRLYPTAELIGIRDALRAKDTDCLIIESDHL